MRRILFRVAGAVFLVAMMLNFNTFGAVKKECKNVACPRCGNIGSDCCQYDNTQRFDYCTLPGNIDCTNDKKAACGGIKFSGTFGASCNGISCNGSSTGLGCGSGGDIPACK